MKFNEQFRLTYKRQVSAFNRFKLDKVVLKKKKLVTQCYTNKGNENTKPNMFILVVRRRTVVLPSPSYNLLQPI